MHGNKSAVTKKSKTGLVKGKPLPKHIQTQLKAGIKPAPAETETTPTVRQALELSTDYGTVNLSIASRIATYTLDSPEIKHTRIREVSFPGTGYKAPQIISFRDADTLLWGNDVLVALKKGSIQHDDVLEFWKLLLYEEHSSSPEMDLLREQLENLDLNIDRLLRVHLKAILKYARAQLQRQDPSVYHSVIDTMPVYLYLGVPQMWGPDAVARMVRAAKAAGFDKVEPVAESVSAAAYQFHEYSDRLRHQCQRGQTVSTGDLGGGTGDFLLARLESECKEGAKVELTNIGKTTGEILSSCAECGSKAVVDEFQKMLVVEAEKRYESLKGASKALQRSEADILKSARTDFIRLMESFVEPVDGSDRITIFGAKDAVNTTWTIWISSDDWVRFFTPAIQNMKSCIDEQDPDILLITGGFGHNEYVRRELRKAYEPKGKVVIDTFTGDDSERPVSVGSLRRYPAIKGRAFSSRGSFGTAREEVYDEERHKDATEDNGIVRWNKKDERYIVYERWSGLTSWDHTFEPQTTHYRSTWHLHTVSPQRRTVSVQMFWSEIQLAESDPIRDGATALNPLRKGVVCWDLPLTLTLRHEQRSLRSMGYKTTKTRTDTAVYEIWTKVEIDAIGANVKARLLLASAKTPPYDVDMQKMEEDVEFEIVDEIMLGEEDFNPFIRPNQ